MSALKKLVNILLILPMFIGYFFISPASSAEPNLMYGAAPEGWGLELAAPRGAMFTSVYFASYGTPNQYSIGSCHSESSIQKVEEAFVGKESGFISADNGVFGDPCSGTYKSLEVVLVYEYLNPVAYLDAPTNLQASFTKDSVHLTWDAPINSGVAVERYAVMWTAEGYNGWAVSSNETSIYISLDTLRSTLPLNTYIMFSIRADNDTLSVYSTNSEQLVLYVEEPPVPVFLCWDGSTVFDLYLCPIEPTPEPTITPTPEPSPTVTIPEPTVTPTVPVAPIVTPTPEPTPTETKSEEPQDSAELAKDLAADGVLTSEEKTELVELLLEEFNSEEAIPAGMIEELGLDYEDLPADQPVTLDNGVVITAEVADAIEIFESPSEVLSTLFTDPSKAFMAVANIGADLPTVVREEAQKVVVASVIVTQVIAGTASLLTRRI